MQRRSCANRFSAALLFLMVLAAGSMSARAADATALVPAEDFVRPAQMGSIKFSPDGRHFAALAENKGFMQLVVADAGVSDLTWMVELPETDFNWHANRRIDAELKSRIGNPDDPIERKVMDAHSPRLLAARIKAPVLLVYGTDDRRVPLRHGTAMRDALQAARGVCEWKTYTGEGHGVTNTKNGADLLRLMEDFLNRNIGPARAATAATAATAPAATSN